MKRMITIFLPLAVLFVSAGCVMEQDVALLENRISALEMDNAHSLAMAEKMAARIDGVTARMEESLGQSGKLSRERYADLKIVMDTLKNDIRLLKGRVEESEHSLDRQGTVMKEREKQGVARLDSAVTRNYQRLVRLEKYMGFEPSELLSGQAGKAPGGEELDEGESYKSAKILLDKGDLDAARSGFEAFIQRFPESENADNARFWIADSYYLEKWFEKAILEYQKVIEKYPKGNKVSAALLKQGYAFASLGEKANARLILKELIKKYPKSREAAIARDKLKTLK